MNIEASLIEHIESGATSDDGAVMLLNTITRGAPLAVAIAVDQLIPLITLSAMSLTASKRIKKADPNDKEAFGVARWALSADPSSSDLVLTLTLKTEGDLSFRLTEALQRALYEALGTRCG